MSARGRPRKDRDDNPGASGGKSPPGTRKKSAQRNEDQIGVKKTTDAKVSSHSKLQESQKGCSAEQQTPKPSKSGEKKAAPRGAARRGSSIDENPSFQPAPEKEKTSKNEKESANVSSHSKLHESQEVCSAEKQTPKPNKIGEKKAAPRGAARRGSSIDENPSKDLQPAPEKEKTSKNEKESDKTPDSKASCPAKPPETRVGRPKKLSRDANSSEESQEPRSPKGSENTNKELLAILEKLKVKTSQRSESSKCVNEIQTKITEYLKRHLDWGKDICVLKTGSYYENLKICQPDEFDVMMAIRVERVTLQPFSQDGAYYSVEMKRHTPRHPLDKYLNEDKTIRASEMLKDFRDKIKEAVEPLDYVTLERKKKGCPAVTLLVKENGNNISIDFVPSLEVHSSWPDFTQNGFNIQNWLSKKVRTEQRQKPFYLVPKYEGKGTAEQDGIMAKDNWRISFSHVEKYILKNHGNSKTCCEGGQKCCRKQCLKLLKYLLQRLKEENLDTTDELCSYHAKTTLLHACADRVKDSEWADNDLSYCFQQLLMDFEGYLRACKLPNFFIPSQNLFDRFDEKKCKLLADYIENQRNNRFPILC